MPLLIPELLPVTTAARLVGVDPRTLKRWITNDPTLAIRIGGRLRVRRVVLERFIADPTVDPGNSGSAGRVA